MKRYFFGYFIFLPFLLLPQQSFSDLYLEPYLGLGTLTRRPYFEFSHSMIGPRRNSWPVIGSFYIRTALGGRVGWSERSLAAGLDISGSYYNNGVIIGISEQFWTVLPGVFLSYQFPGFFRAYGTLIPHGFIMGAMEQKKPCSMHCSSLPQDIKSEKPVIRSLKLGVSYTGLPFLNINLVYQPFYFIATGNTKREGFWMHGIAAYISYIF